MYIVHPQTWLIFQASYKKPDMEFINQTVQVPKRGRPLGGWVISLLIFSAVVLGDSQIQWLQRHAGICESEMTVSSFLEGSKGYPQNEHGKKGAMFSKMEKSLFSRIMFRFHSLWSADSWIPMSRNSSAWFSTSVFFAMEKRN